MLRNAYNPSFNLEKSMFRQQQSNSSGQRFTVNNNRFIYKLSKDEITGDSRPINILQEEMKDDFYDNIPIIDEGHCLTNKDVGLNPSKKLKNLGILTPHSEKDA